MREHHKKAIENLKEMYINDRDVIAVIFSGSVARGTERPDSDIDGTLIVTPEKSAEMKKQDKMAFNMDMEKDPYEGGYYDLKIMTVNDLEVAAKKCNDPNRFYFVGSKILFSHDDRVQPLLDQIVTYTDEIQEERIKVCYAGFELSNGYSWNNAVAENNRYMLMKSACDLVLFGIRMLYAYNKVFWPCHRNFLEPRYMNQLKDVPDNILGLANDVINSLSTESRDKFYNAIIGFHNWGYDGASAYSNYINYYEKFWLYDCTNPYEM